MDSYPNTSNAQPSEGNPAYSAGLEAGLVGSVLILIEQLLQNFLDLQALGLILGLIRVSIWLGVGALAVYWLKGKGSVESSDQTKAGITAGLLTGLVTGILLVIFVFVQSKTIEDIPLPIEIPLEIINRFSGVLLICFFGLLSFIIATAFSFGGSLLMRSFIGKPVQPIPEEQFQPQMTVSPQTQQQDFPQQEVPPQRLDALLSREGLPLELHPYVAAYLRGEIADARAAFVRFIRQNPSHAYAWLWLAVMLDDPTRQKECVNRALTLEPGNEIARKMLTFLERPPTAY